MMHKRFIFEFYAMQPPIRETIEVYAESEDKAYFEAQTKFMFHNLDVWPVLNIGCKILTDGEF